MWCRSLRKQLEEEMIEENDYRLIGQEKYLAGKMFYWHMYKPRSEMDDHAHCAFCWEKFSLFEGTSREGYFTLDDYYWICDHCFKDFQERYSFHVQHSEDTM